MEGFVFGLAISVTVGQLPKLFGLEKGPGDTISQFVHLVTHLGGPSWTTFAVGAVALALLFTLDRVPRVPGGLVVLAAAIAVSRALNLDAHGVSPVGKVPAGLPSLHGLTLSAPGCSAGGRRAGACRSPRSTTALAPGPSCRRSSRRCSAW
jgi:sulfate permease, SulP family